MEQVKCGFCGKPITNKTEVEYSSYFNEFYCGYNCATDRYTEAFGTMIFEFDEDDMKDDGLVLKSGILHRTY